MEALSTSSIFLFDAFRLDRHGLFRRGENAAATPVEIGSRAPDVLGVLAPEAGRTPLQGRDYSRRLAEDGRRGQQPQRPDFDLAPRARSRRRAGQLYPDDSRARLPLCRAGYAGQTCG